MLSRQEYQQIKEELLGSQKPFFFFHDDPDGLCSFLLLYRLVNRGKGMVVKQDPRIKIESVKKVQEYGADKVFITDIAMVDQEFIDAVGIPVIWIDHHQPLERKNVLYFNPRLHGNDNHPASFLCYNAVNSDPTHDPAEDEIDGGNKNGNTDQWIAAVGAIGDYFIPAFMRGFAKKNPDLLSEDDIVHPNKILFQTRLGLLIRMFAFALKGKTADYTKCIKILTRIDDPYELLEGKTARGRFILKRYDFVNKTYQKLRKQAIDTISEDKILLFKYEEDTMSLTGELANELLHECPDKVVIIARNKGGRYKCSLRSAKYTLPPMLEKAFLGIDGYGGGHEHACGANINENDFPVFLERLREQL